MSKIYVETSQPDLEEAGICKEDFKNFEKCMIIEEGEFTFCEKENLLFKKCKYSNTVNLGIYTKNNIDPEKYIELCKKRVDIINKKLEKIDLINKE